MREFNTTDSSWLWRICFVHGFLLRMRRALSTRGNCLFRQCDLTKYTNNRLGLNDGNRSHMSKDLSRWEREIFRLHYGFDRFFYYKFIWGAPHTTIRLQLRANNIMARVNESCRWWQQQQRRRRQRRRQYLHNLYHTHKRRWSGVVETWYKYRYERTTKMNR